MAEVERYVQVEEQFSGDDESSSFIKSSEDVEKEEVELGCAFTLQGSDIHKEGKKFLWSDDHINELIDIICESDYYRKSSFSQIARQLKMLRVTWPSRKASSLL